MEQAIKNLFKTKRDVAIFLVLCIAIGGYAFPKIDFFGARTGPTKLANLSDVDTSSVANAEALIYNSTTGKWEPGAVSAGTGSLGSWSTSTDELLIYPTDSRTVVIGGTATTGPAEFEVIGASIMDAVTMSGNVLIGGTLGVTGNVSLSGNLEVTGTTTMGGVIFPNYDGTANQVLKTDGSGNLVWGVDNTAAGAFATTSADYWIENTTGLVTTGILYTSGGALAGATTLAGVNALLPGETIASTTWVSGNYQPLEATLTDIADGTITENLVNTANPWADNEVANDITASNYLPLTGGTISSNLTVSGTTTTDVIEGSAGDMQLVFDWAGTSTPNFCLGACY